MISCDEKFGGGCFRGWFIWQHGCATGCALCLSTLSCPVCWLSSSSWFSRGCKMAAAVPDITDLSSCIQRLEGRGASLPVSFFFFFFCRERRSFQLERRLSLQVFLLDIISKQWVPCLCSRISTVWESEYLLLFSGFVLGEGLCYQGRSVVN